LALDWDHQQLLVVSANLKKGHVRIEKAAAWEVGHNPSTAGADVLGQFLRERLKEAGIHPAPVLACVGRDRLILKDITHPPAAAADEPAMVRFQVIKELTDPAEQVIIDYVSVGQAGTNGDRHALALVLRRDLVTNYQGLCRAAGLKLAALTPRSFGTIVCLKQLVGTSVLTPAPQPADAAVAVLTVGKPWAEFCVVRGERVLFSRSFTAGATLAGDVRRNLAVYGGQAPHDPVRAVYVTGAGEHGTLWERLRELLEVPVYPLDPFAGLEAGLVPADNRGVFAGPVGLLHARSQSKELPINFVKPKEPKPVVNPNRNKLVLAAAFAAAVLVALGGLGYSQIRDRNKKLEELNQEKSALDNQLASLDDDVKRVKALDEWSQADVNWLDELYDLVDRIPDLTKIRAVELQCVDNDRKAKEKYAGRVTFRGLTTREYEPMNHLVSLLVQDGHYRTTGWDPKANRSARSFQFPTQFDLRFDVEKVPPSKYVRRMPEEAEIGDERPARSGRGPNRGPGRGNRPGFGGVPAMPLEGRRP
jgi:hypothetical protein